MTSMTMGPTMANPDTLDSVADLRRELRHANEALMQQFSTITRYDELGTQLVGALNRILILHIREDAHAMVECLDAYLADRPGLREKLEEQIESDRMRKVH